MGKLWVAISLIICFLEPLNFCIMLYCKTKVEFSIKKSSCRSVFPYVSGQYHITSLIFFTEFRTHKFFTGLECNFFNIEIKCPSRFYVIQNDFINNITIPKYLAELSWVDSLLIHDYEIYFFSYMKDKRVVTDGLLEEFVFLQGHCLFILPVQLQIPLVISLRLCKFQVCLCIRML